MDLVKEKKHRFHAGLISLSTSAFLLGLKFWGFYITGSEAVFSDAMETIVNVAAAMVALYVIIASAKPADREHPYGHGKFEFFSAAFEGSLITFAAILIMFEAIDALVNGSKLRNLDHGISVILLAAVINFILGLHLRYAGKRHKSPALEASAKHVLSDVITSVGVFVGLILVRITGKEWIDAVTAILVAAFLGSTGGKVVYEAFSSLVDKEDINLLKQLLKSFTVNWFPGIIRVHHTRIMRSGNYHHIDAHVVLPEFWTVEQAHEETNRFEDKVIKDYPYEGEIHFHMDPCRRAYCKVCDYPKCPVRKEMFVERKPATFEEFVSPTESEEFQ
ncbi:MAG: cation transporter [Proteobacteria bacterium SG_bin7]|nr:MAG: cation transporter [Proteobacteria bacterium SG_bin7]